MKKLIPAFIAIVLIGVVIAVNFGGKVQEKYSYGTDRADLYSYFKLNEGSDEVAIILQDSRIDNKAKLRNGVVYFDMDTVKELFTQRFYYDYNENLLLYTKSDDTISTEIGGTEYIEGGENKAFGYSICFTDKDTLYISAEYVKKFANFYYEVYENPNRMQLYTQWGEKNVATINKDTQVRWKGGVKSEILTDISEGEDVEILEVMDEWTKVKTENVFIGYVPNSTLSATSVMKENPVTTVKEEEYISLTKDEKINMVWHNIEYPQDAASLYNACNYIKSVNVISPTWYWLTDNEGNFHSVASADYVAAATKMGMEVWPLISNLHYGEEADVSEILSYTSKREKLIKGLIDETKLYGGKGINIDFEDVPSKSATHFLQFIRELCVACHKAGLIVSVDNYVPCEYRAHYNIKEQGLFADYIVIMGYDEHYEGSESGSVSSLNWMKEGIENTIAVVDKKKVINGIPFYTRVWKTADGKTTSVAIDMIEANNYIKKHSIKTSVDESTGQNYGEATIDGVFCQVWMEDAYSVTNRLNVMNTLGIAGVAEWKLGQETRDIWDLIEAYMKY